MATKVCLGLGVVPAFRSRENFAPSTSQPCRSHAGVDALLERDFGEGQTMTPGDPSRLQARLCQLRKVGVSVHRPQQLLRQEHYVVQCGGRQKPVESPGDTDSRVLDAMQAAAGSFGAAHQLPASSLGFIIQPRQRAIDAGLTQHPRGDISRIETILKLKCAEPLLQSILVSIPQSSIVDQMNGIGHIFPRSRHLCARSAPTLQLAIDQRHLSAASR